MKKPELIDESEIPIYKVKIDPFDWADFTQWLENLEHHTVGIEINNVTRFFYTEWERIRFVDGFRFAWEQFVGKGKQ